MELASKYGGFRVGYRMQGEGRGGGGGGGEGGQSDRQRQGAALQLFVPFKSQNIA